MTGKQFIAATAVLAGIAVFLCACVGKPSDAQTTETTEPYVSTPWSEAQVFTLPQPETAAQTESGTPDTSAAAAAQEGTDAATALGRIEAARAVYAMFSETRPQLDKSDSIEYEEGLFYYRVSDPQFPTMEKLRTYVSGFFSDEITQRLLNVGMYAESDGKLYALDVGMQLGSQKGTPQVEITDRTKTSETYLVTFGEGDAAQTFRFVYAQVEKGRWVFTHFEMY